MSEDMPVWAKKMQDDFRAMQDDFRAEFQALQTELKESIQALRTEQKESIQALDKKLEDVSERIQATEDEQSLRRVGPLGLSANSARSDLLPRDSEERGRYAGFGGPRGSNTPFRGFGTDHEEYIMHFMH